MNKWERSLTDALVTLRNHEESESFLTAFLSDHELAMMVNRWHVLALLATRQLSQRQISAETGVGIGTVSRANRALRGPGGDVLYRLLARVDAAGDSP